MKLFKINKCKLDNIILYQYIIIYYLTPHTGRLFGTISLVRVSLAILVVYLVYKVITTHKYKLTKNINHRLLLISVILFVISIFLSILYSEEFFYSFYESLRFLFYIILPFIYIGFIKHINFNRLIYIVIFIAFIQVIFAIFEVVIEKNIYDYFFTYVTEVENNLMRFGIPRAKTCLGPLSLAYFFTFVYPLTYLKNDLMYRVTRYMIPVGVILTGSIAGIGLVFMSLIIMNIKKLFVLKEVIKLLFIVFCILMFLYYSGIYNHIIDAVETVINAAEAIKEVNDNHSGFSFGSRTAGLYRVFELIPIYSFHPLGFNIVTLKFMDIIGFRTDISFVFHWIFEIGIWGVLFYIIIYIQALKILTNLKSSISFPILVSLIMYFIFSLSTEHLDSLLLPFIMFGIILRNFGLNAQIFKLRKISYENPSNQ